MTDLSTAVATSSEAWPADPASNDDGAPGTPADTQVAEPVSTVLDRLAEAGWHTLNDRLATVHPRLVIDHVVVGPGGIFAIDSHSLASSGPDFSVISDANQPAKLAAAQSAADAIRSLLPPLTRQYVVAVLAYADQSPMSMSRGPIQICTTSMLQRVIDARRNVLSRGEVDDVVAALDTALKPAGTPARPPAARVTARPPTAAPLAETPAVPASMPSVSAASTPKPTAAEPRRGRRFRGRRGGSSPVESTASPTTDAAALELAPTYETAPPQQAAPTPAPTYETAPTQQAAPTHEPAPTYETAPTQQAPATHEPAPTYETEPTQQAASSYEPAPTHNPTATSDVSPAPDAAAEQFEPHGDAVDQEVHQRSSVVHDDTTVADDFRQLRDTDDTDSVDEPLAEGTSARSEVTSAADDHAGIIEDEVIPKLHPEASVVSVMTPEAAFLPPIKDVADLHVAPSTPDLAREEEIVDRAGSASVADLGASTFEVSESLPVDEPPVEAEHVDAEHVEAQHEVPEPTSANATLDDHEVPSWEELSIEDIRAAGQHADVPTIGELALHRADLEASIPTASATSAVPSITPRRPGARRKAPVKPWHRLVPSKSPPSPSRRVRGSETDDFAAEPVPAVEVAPPPAVDVAPLVIQDEIPAAAFIDTEAEPSEVSAEAEADSSPISDNDAEAEPSEASAEADADSSPISDNDAEDARHHDEAAEPAGDASVTYLDSPALALAHSPDTTPEVDDLVDEDESPAPVYTLAAIAAVDESISTEVTDESEAAIDHVSEPAVDHVSAWHDDVAADEVEAPVTRIVAEVELEDAAPSSDDALDPSDQPADALNLVVSRWKAARVGQPAKHEPALPEDEPTEASSRRYGSARKQAVVGVSGADASMPEGLSSRGRMMYAAMNNGVDPALMHGDAPEKKPLGRVIRKVLILAVVAGILVLSGLHYTEISRWVDDHVDLPSIGGPADTPHKGGKNDPAQGKGTKSESGNDADKAPASNKNQ